MKTNFDLKNNLNISATHHHKVNSNCHTISIITICYNAEKTIKKTIQSVADQSNKNFEYIIVDGKSKDSTLTIINEYRQAIAKIISEPDLGIYDAMNKAISHACGEWILFLNSGDILCNQRTIDLILKEIKNSGDFKFLYSDVILKNESEEYLLKCDHNRLILNHQCSIYKKSLHNTYGMYLVAPKLTISDYIFFSTLPSSVFKKIRNVISKYDTTGISQSSESRRQKFAVDFLFGKIGVFDLLTRVLFYGNYLYLKKMLRKFRN